MDDSSNQIKSGELNPIKTNRIIPISIKVKAIELSEDNGNHKAAIAYNVDRSTIIYWQKKKRRLSKH